MKILGCQFVICIILLGITEAWAATYYVATTGNNSNTGLVDSAGGAWLTIGKAAQTMVAGDTVKVHAGTYQIANGSGDHWIPALNPSNSGTAGNRITFQAFTGETVIITYAAGGGLGGPLIGADGRDYITWDGFIIQEVASRYVSDTGPTVIHDSDFIIFNALDIRSVFVQTSPPGDNHNSIRIEGSPGFPPASNAIIQNCKIHGVQGPAHNTSGITSYNTDTIQILHNEFYDSYTGVFIKGPTDGTPHNFNWTIQYNIFHNTTDPWRFSHAATVTATQNIVYGGQDWGDVPTMWEYAEGNGANCNVYNNTQYSMTRGMWSWQTGLSGSVRFYNNITSLVTTPIYTEGGSNSWLTLSDYNDFHGMTNLLDNGTSRTLAQWQSVKGLDLHSINANPLFVNPGALDFHLQAGSPALNAGRVGGTSAGAPVNMGAYLTGTECIGIESLCAAVPSTVYFSGDLRISGGMRVQ